MAVSTPEQKKVKVGDTVYTLQMVSARWLFDHTDRCKNADGVLQNTKYVEGLLENVVISPKVTLDDFDGKVKALQRLSQAMEEFVTGDDVEVIKNVDVPESNTTNGK